MKKDKEQLELLNEVLEQERKRGANEKWLQFIKSYYSYFMRLGNGDILAIEKSRIKTSFCFSFGFCGISDKESEDNANKMAEIASTNKDYFIKENLKDINKKLEELDNSNTITMGAGSGTNGRMGLDFIDLWEYQQRPYYKDNKCYYRLTNEEKIKLKGLLSLELNDLVKRLFRYLKRYGLSKIDSWSFLSD